MSGCCLAGGFPSPWGRVMGGGVWGSQLGSQEAICPLPVRHSGDERPGNKAGLLGS